MVLKNNLGLLPRAARKAENAAGNGNKNSWKR
jgi:hypothetical protein